MRTHQEIDERSREMAKAIVRKIDEDPRRAGVLLARQNCRRWMERAPLPVLQEWLEILDRPWEEIREVLLDQSERGCMLRQSNPFCGILTPRERWAIYEEFRKK